MPTCETHPCDSLPAIGSARRGVVRIILGALCSSLVFIFSFLSLGALARTLSFEFAYSYTFEMLAELEILLIWVLPILPVCATPGVFYSCIRNCAKPPLWSVISGVASFLLFNSAWGFTQRLVEVLRDPMSGFVEVDFVRSVTRPLAIAIVIELTGIVLLSRAFRDRLPNAGCAA